MFASHKSGNDFYLESTWILNEASIPFLVGGAFALRAYTGIVRDTKDFDLMVRARDRERILEVFRQAGYRAETTFSHWLAKVHLGELFIDVIFSSGNGLCPVDDQWFEHSNEVELFGISVRVCPVEELIWQKCYIMERERYDGADVAHLIRSCGRTLDWARLIRRFGPDWRVLLSHLILFGFIFPSDRKTVPDQVMRELTTRLSIETEQVSPEGNTCQGPFLSRAQYLFDIERGGLEDARFDKRCAMTGEEIAAWTSAIEGATLRH